MSEDESLDPNVAESKVFNVKLPNVAGVKLPESKTSGVYEPRNDISGSEKEIRRLAETGAVNGMLVDGILTTAVRASKMASKGDMSVEDSQIVYDTSVKIAQNLGIPSNEINNRIKKIEEQMNQNPAAYDSPPFSGKGTYNG